MSILKIDIDIPFEEFMTMRRFWEKNARRILSYLGIPILKIRYKKSATGRTHVIVHIAADISDSDAVLLSLLLGSDWRREYINLERIETMQRSHTRLFDHKERRFHYQVIPEWIFRI